MESHFVLSQFTRLTDGRTNILLMANTACIVCNAVKTKTTRKDGNYSNALPLEAARPASFSRLLSQAPETHNGTRR